MKKKILIIAVAACLLALTIAGTSIAYFTDTEEYTNVFTAGKVDITLTYAETLVNDEDANVPGAVTLSTHVYPGQSYQIDATITNTNDANTEAAYVGAIITLKDAQLASIVSVNGDTDNYPVAIRELLVGLAKDGYTVKYTLTADTLTLYIVRTEALAKNTNCEILDRIAIPKEWDNAEMAAFADLELNVIAYATQTVGFANATEAITTAFANQWNGFAGATALD